MMLYVFHVDVGVMKTFDMRLVSESVGNLKEAVEKSTGIPVQKQVLLISGGECLDPNNTICSYAAGTDTNPIFLFSKAVIENSCPPPGTTDPDSEDELTERIKEAIDLPSSFSTVQRRALLAQQLYEKAKEQIQTCERLVHDQHLQQQGWSAVVANLDDITVEFSNRAKIFKEYYSEYLKVREAYITFLTDFREDLETLRKIPALPVLFQPEAREDGAGDEEETQEPQSQQDELATLFDWIAHSDEAMDQLYETCERGLHQFSEVTCNKTLSELEETLANADNISMKEVKGLGERLSGLESLMREAKRCLQEQSEMAKSFHNNLARASNLKDPSILPDLCMSHRKQLVQMAQNHQRLTDIKRRCIKAKEELSANLFHRLKWVMFVEDNLMKQDEGLMIHHDCLKNLKRHLDALQQIHLTPAMYLSAVAEVVRRRKFSQSFLLWASDIACQLLAIHNSEVARRKEFQGQFEGHFLNTLFPGMADLPPSFATEAPPPFDSDLPKIHQEDVERLREQLPEYVAHLSTPDTSTFTNFFMIKSLVKTELDKVEDSQDIKDVEQKLVQVVQGVGLASTLDNNLLRGTGSEASLTTAHGLPHLRDIDKGCESETDTEEFEKVGQSPLEPSPRPGTQDAATCTEVGPTQNPPPKKPPRSFRTPHILAHSSCSTDSFTSESCFNSHHHQQQQQQQQQAQASLQTRSKSISPNTPQSPRDAAEIVSPHGGHQPAGDFLSDEYYIDESLPSSLSIETGEFVKQLDTANNVVAMLQDNLQISRSEHERLKGTLECLGQLSTQALAQLQGELKAMKSTFLNDLNVLESGYKSLSASFHSLVVETARAEKAAAEKQASVHEAELNSMKQMYAEKEEELGNFKIANIVLEQKFQRSNEELGEIKAVLLRVREEHSAKMEQLQKEVMDKEADKERILKETSDRLNREHKAELENIRSRFKLMTMERSPSESSLEKIGDFTSIPNHESILLQMTETFEFNKDKAVREAIDKENDRWQKILNERLQEMEAKFAEEKRTIVEDVARQINEEKEKQIDLLSERERNLNLEIAKYKSTIQQLTEAEVVTSCNDLRNQLEALRRENDALKDDLEGLRRPDMTASVAVLAPIAENDNVMTASAVESICESATTTTASGKKSKSFDRCPKGLKIDIIWDETHHNYRCDLEGKLYFIHCDCLPAMSLEVVDGLPNKQRTRGEVLDKEYCLSKKDDNRYNVPKGTKFFRVKVKPLEEEEEVENAEPEEIRPESVVEKSFYHDSGVVEGAVEEAAVAIENLDNEANDR